MDEGARQALSWLDILNASGTLGMLVLLVIMFMRGELLPKKVWETLTQKTVAATAEAVAKTVCHRVRLSLRAELGRQLKELDQLRAAASSEAPGRE